MFILVTIVVLVCVVTKDMPDNSTAVIKNIEIILHKDIRDNKYQGITPIL